MAEHCIPRAFVIGDPIAQSKSPLIHNHWLTQAGLQGHYEAHHIVPDKLQCFLEKLLADPHRPGGNVTAPHKESVHHWLKLQSDKAELTAMAARLGAVNTLYRRGEVLIGDNTDGYGFAANLDEHAPNWDADLSETLVIGAGGASRAVIVALDHRRHPGEVIHVVNRTVGRAQALIADLQLVDAQAHSFDELNRLSSTASFAVNTTSLGMSGHQSSTILTDAASQLRVGTVATDIVYTPLMTPFLVAARQAGATTIDGLGMLLHQAVPGFEAWFGVRPTVTADVRKMVLEAMEVG
ncbi:MAG: shikimate dehydrogenase [Pseudomonadota bacterium]